MISNFVKNEFITAYPMSKPRFEYPDDEELDAYTDDQYKEFVDKLVAFHRKHWPSSTLAIPRRKTPAEREVERKLSEEFWSKAH